MATARARRSDRPRSALISLVVLSVLFTGFTATGERRAAAMPGSEVVPAVVAAYGPVGALAVVVTRQQVPIAGEPLRGYQARRARATASADNGAAARTPVPTASMVKLFVAEDVLHRARRGLVRLAADDAGLLTDMIRRSDDRAASVLWDRYGGGRMVTDVATRYGLSGTTPPASPGQWGETLTTAQDLARFLSLLPVVAHPADAAAIQDWMASATPQAADGFDQQFGIFGTAPPRTPVKQGWMCCVGGTRHLHSVGIIGSRVVVLLSVVPRQVGYATARAALDAAAAAVPAPRSP